jgi:GntR family transcriptional regulator, transcriptional repressor for pyruvate dehydrogenase complex
MNMSTAGHATSAETKAAGPHTPADGTAPALVAPAPGARASIGLTVQRIRPAYRQVADELRAQIISGVLKAGEKLPSEAELCRMFGASRSTVREGLRVLASQHLVETVRGVQGGTFVALPDPLRVAEDVARALGLLVMSPKLEVDDLLEARLILEPPAARLAAERRNPETVEAIWMAARADRDSRDPSHFAQHIDFHMTILMATSNLLLTFMGQPISEVLRTRLQRSQVAADRWDEVDDDHLEIAQAIAAGSGGEAETLMRAHLLSLQPLYEASDIAGGARDA